MDIIARHIESAVESHRNGNLKEAEDIYHKVLNMDPTNPTVLYLLGDIMVRKGHNGLAINLLTNSIKHEPRQETYVTLGVALKQEFYTDEARQAWEKGLEFGESDELYNNLSALYADSGEPEKAIPLCNKALARNPDNPHAHWNLALALLTAGTWAAGWDEHEWRLNAALKKSISARHYGLPRWTGVAGQKVIVHGEQGIGDEVMFLSCLPDVVSRADEVVVECEPRLMDIIERSFPGVRTYATEEALKAHETGFHAVVPMGSLPQLFRRDAKSFTPHGGYLKADPDRVAYWRGRFREAGPGPYVGVAWVGGTKITRVHQRTIEPENFAFLKSATPISLQYGPFAESGAKRGGFVWFPESDGQNIDEQAAMIEACDVIVSVCQTLVHLAGALGKDTWVLTPKHSSWRYGRTNRMLWYPAVKLFRQTIDGKWEAPIREVQKRFEMLFTKETA